MKAALIALVVLIAACNATVDHLTSTSPIPGPLGDTWTTDGATWRQVAGPGPAPRYFATLAYDAPRYDYVLFGGQAGAVSFDDTWTWNGHSWKQMSPPHQPPPRRGAAMAYDPNGRVVILYGGLIPDQAEGYQGADTWAWDGKDWTEVGPAKGGPGPREGARMVTTDDGVLLFGGHIGNVTYYADAWTWNGTAWSGADGDRRPPGRGSAAVAWDQARHSLLVFGGIGSNATGGPGAQGKLLGDTWIFGGGQWISVAPAGPPPLSFANAIWDPSSHRVLVLFGMKCPNPADDEWAWDGASWSHAGAVGAAPRWGAASAQDPDGKVLVFGGSNEAGC